MITGKEAFEKFYQNHEDPWYLSWRAKQQLRYEFYIDMLKPFLHKQSTLIDIGCGRGYFAKKLFDTNSFSFIEGIDISEIAIKQAQELYQSSSGLYFQAQALPKIYCDGKLFDFVVALEVIYYLESKEERKLAFLNIHNLLKPNGLFLISVNVNQGSFTEEELMDNLLHSSFSIKKVDYIRDSFYIKWENYFCSLYDVFKELRQRAYYTFPIIVLLQVSIKFLLSSKIIARLFLFLTKFSKNNPSIIFILSQKNA